MSAEREASELPARGYSWPRLEPGHTLTLRHGAYSPRTLQPLAEELAGTAVDVAPWIKSPTFRAAVADWAWVEAEALLLRRYVDEVGPLDTEGEERPAAKRLDRVATRAANLRQSLGLDPQSLASLMAKLASLDGILPEGGTEAVKAAGREILAARRADG